MALVQIVLSAREKDSDGLVSECRSFEVNELRVKGRG